MVWGCAKEVEELARAATGRVVDPKYVQVVGRNAVRWCGGISSKDVVHVHTVWAASSVGGPDGGGKRGWEAGVEAGNAGDHVVAERYVIWAGSDASGFVLYGQNDQAEVCADGFRNGV